MKRGKSSISKAKSHREIGDFWDTHDLSDFWDQTKRIDFDVNIESEITYYSLEKRLAKEVQSIAQKRGVSADTLINLWVQEKIQEQNR
jgi:hypothetical protein